MISRILTLCVICLLFGCTSPKNPNKPPSEYAAMGTRAIIDLVVSPKTPSKRAEAAARELSTRKLTPQEGSQLAAALPTLPSDNLRLEILKVIAAQRHSHLYADLIRLIPNAPSPTAGAAYLHTARALLPGSPLLRADLSRLLREADSPQIRIEAARFLVNDFPRDAESVFLGALESETSATVATFMTEFLATRGTAESLDVLTALSNDLGRTFVSDDFLGKRFTAATVRMAAVRGVERLRRMPPTPR